MRKEVFRSDNVIFRSAGINLLDNFNMHIFEGEVFGLFFADNRGKNELIRLALEGGVLEYGSIFFGDRQINSFLMPAQTRSAGISLISPAELLLDEMTVAENVFVMRKNFLKYVINSGVIRSQFERLAEEYEADINGGTLVRDLKTVDRYIVRLFKAVIEGSSLIIVKDIGLSPGGPDMERFHNYVRRFAETGVSFLYISGDTSELFSVCDRVGVAERGGIVSTIGRESFDESRFRSYYFDPDKVKSNIEQGSYAVLDMKIAMSAGIPPLELKVTEGECVLLWDRSDTMIEKMVGILSGEIKPVPGYIIVDDRELFSYKGVPPLGIIREAPARNGVFSDLSYLDNLCMKVSHRMPELWRKTSVKQNIRNEYYPIIGDDIDALPPLSLPAESMYNLVYLREHIFGPKLVVLVRPFMDTDIKLKMHILSLIEMLRKAGAALLILDSSVSESSAIADRTLSIKNGQIEREILS